MKFRYQRMQISEKMTFTKRPGQPAKGRSKKATVFKHFLLLLGSAVNNSNIHVLAAFRN